MRSVCKAFRVCVSWWADPTVHQKTLMRIEMFIVSLFSPQAAVLLLQNKAA